MQLSPVSRKSVLTAHLVSSLGWVGALMVFLAHAIAGWASSETQMVRAAATAMEICAWFAILPLAIATVATGFLQAFGTPWGLLRHYWVVFKLLLTVVATAVLLTKLGPIAGLSELAAGPAFSAGIAQELRLSMVVHAIGGLVVLIAAAALAVFKPEGRTRLARGQDVAPVPGWVRAAGWGLGLLMLLVLLMVLLGKHGPRSHAEATPPPLVGTPVV